MPKFTEWLKKHVVLVVGVVAIVGALVAAGSIMLSSITSYQGYEKDYYTETINAKAHSPAAPADVYIDDEFAVYEENSSKVLLTKSSYGKNLSITAEDATYAAGDGATDKLLTEGEGAFGKYLGNMATSGGTITLAFTMGKNAYVDFDIILSSSLPGAKPGTIVDTDSLLDYVTIKVNGNEIYGDISLKVNKSGNCWHHLVLESMVLPEGDNEIIIKGTESSPVDNAYKVMPNFRNATIYTDVAVSLKK